MRAAGIVLPSPINMFRGGCFSAGAFVESRMCVGLRTTNVRTRAGGRFGDDFASGDVCRDIRRITGRINSSGRLNGSRGEVDGNGGGGGGFRPAMNAIAELLMIPNGEQSGPVARAAPSD